MDFTRSEIRKARAGLKAAQRHAKAALEANGHKITHYRHAALQLKHNAEARYDSAGFLTRNFPQRNKK
jgi:hypothetical protein